MSTSAARVDIEADRISSRIITESDSGITLARSSGISLSYMGIPLLNTWLNSGSEGDMNMRVVDPI